MTTQIHITIPPTLLIPFTQKYGIGNRAERIRELIRADLELKDLCLHDQRKNVKEIENRYKLEGDLLLVERDKLNQLEEQNKQLELEAFKHKEHLEDFKDRLNTICVFCKEDLTELNRKDLFNINNVQYFSHRGCFMDNAENLSKVKKEIEGILEKVDKGELPEWESKKTS